MPNKFYMTNISPLPALSADRQAQAGISILEFRICDFTEVGYGK
jgi:hypothetical protein